VYAAGSQQGRNVVVGPLVYALAVGMSVADVSGKAIFNQDGTLVAEFKRLVLVPRHEPGAPA